MEGLAFAIRAYWFRALGFCLAAFGTLSFLLLNGQGLVSRDQGILLVLIGCGVLVFDISPFRTGENGERSLLTPSTRFPFGGLVLFSIACGAPIVWSAFANGWNEQATYGVGLIGMGLIAAVTKWVWDKLRSRNETSTSD